MVADCGHCQACNDNPIYGGPGIDPKICIHRHCVQWTIQQNAQCAPDASNLAIVSDTIPNVAMAAGSSTTNCKQCVPCLVGNHPDYCHFQNPSKCSVPNSLDLLVSIPSTSQRLWSMKKYIFDRSKFQCTMCYTAFVTEAQYLLHKYTYHSILVVRNAEHHDDRCASSQYFLNPSVQINIALALSQPLSPPPYAFAKLEVSILQDYMLRD